MPTSQGTQDVLTQDEEGRQDLDALDEKFLGAVVGELGHVEHVVGDAAHDGADLGVVVVGVVEPEQVVEGVPAHVRLDVDAHDVADARHEILRSTVDEDEIIEFTGEQTDDVRDSQGNPMRPHIVFFGEQVPMFDAAVEEMRDTDVVMIVGTSMQVYPAASLIHYAPPDAERYLVDPNPQGVGADVEVIPKRAAEGVPALVEHLISQA